MDKVVSAFPYRLHLADQGSNPRLGSFFLAIFRGFSFRFVVWRARVICTLSAHVPRRLAHTTFPELYPLLSWDVTCHLHVVRAR